MHHIALVASNRSETKKKCGEVELVTYVLILPLNEARGGL
jgi:hypothetical protein